MQQFTSVVKITKLVRKAHLLHFNNGSDEVTRQKATPTKLQSNKQHLIQFIISIDNNTVLLHILTFMPRTQKMTLCIFLLISSWFSLLNHFLHIPKKLLGFMISMAN